MLTSEFGHPAELVDLSFQLCGGRSNRSRGVVDLSGPITGCKGLHEAIQRLYTR